MCGIVAYIGNQDAKEILFDGLTRLEYRGYDSAGIAVAASGETHLRRAQGKLSELGTLIKNQGLPAFGLGIGHTRWATHGRPNETNAHPHHVGPITIVHNGIIENYRELREGLQKKGHKFRSETDSEILAHLVLSYLTPKRSTREALRKALTQVEGSYAVALLNHDEPGQLWVARLGSPLVLGLGKKENFVASDVPALLPYTKQVIFLEDGELAEVSRSKVVLEDAQGKSVKRRPQEISWNLSMAEKDGHKHFMLKEIFEQPRALTDTLRGHLKYMRSGVFLAELEEIFPKKEDLKKIERIYLLACGTSWHASLAAKYFMEPWSGSIVQVEQASEFRYRDPLIDKNTLVIAVSQSGETADTLVALKQAKAKGAKVLTITNVVESSLAREADAVIYTHAGPEIGVAATKTFTCQLAALQLLGLWLGRKRGRIKKDEAEDLLQELVEVPKHVGLVLEQAETIRELALKLAHETQFLFMGRGPQFPIALEGALKLKEISYLHAEGYSAGELKHGPIALIDHGTPVISIALKDKYYEKMLSNIQEVHSRQAAVIALVNEGDQNLNEISEAVIELPKVHPLIAPILSVIPLQLLSYYIADHKGHDVDQPRNLAKSVTVE